MTDDAEGTEFEKDCFHESSHAVIAVLCGLDFPEAYVRDGNGAVDIVIQKYQQGILSANCADKSLTTPYIYAWYAGELAVECQYSEGNYSAQTWMSPGQR